jgi:phosphoglycolate phosphatase
MNINCLLLDLDGTLIDSRSDLASAVNLMLADIGRPQLSQPTIVSFVGEGMSTLVERALASDNHAGAVDLETAVEIFRRHYQQHLLDQTVAYPGVFETLTDLQKLPMAVVTNKPLTMTTAILDGLNLSQFFTVVLGGDSLSERKPSPAPLIAAARKCGVPATECMMIGDTKIDILAGHAAQMTTCGFTAGFRGRDELRNAGADFLIDEFRELPALLRKLA